MMLRSAWFQSHRTWVGEGGPYGPMVRGTSVRNHRGPPRGFGEHGDEGIFSGEQRSKNEGNRGTKAILGNREHRKSRFWFWGTGDKGHLFQGNKGTGTPPPPKASSPCDVHGHTHTAVLCILCVFSTRESQEYITSIRKRPV